MATMWRKAMLYLGLGPDEEYDDYDPGYDDPAPASGTVRQSPASSPMCARSFPTSRPQRKPASRTVPNSLPPISSPRRTAIRPMIRRWSLPALPGR